MPSTDNEISRMNWMSTKVNYWVISYSNVNALDDNKCTYYCVSVCVSMCVLCVCCVCLCVRACMRACMTVQNASSGLLGGRLITSDV